MCKAIYYSVEVSIRCVIDIVKMHKTMANDRGLSKKQYPWKTVETLENDRHVLGDRICEFSEEKKTCFV